MRVRMALRLIRFDSQRRNREAPSENERNRRFKGTNKCKILIRLNGDNMNRKILQSFKTLVSQSSKLPNFKISIKVFHPEF